MAKRWTKEEEKKNRQELTLLYVMQNKTIAEIALILNLSESSVFCRLKRLNITSTPHKKTRYRNQRDDVVLPAHSAELAEFFGIMLGDGHVSHYQVVVTLGTKEFPYVLYVQDLMQRLFGVPAKISLKRRGHRDVYIGSTKITKWLKAEGLVSNKVLAQVDAPKWLLSKPAYARAFVRGFFDTDGSVYKLKFGRQISFTNHSAPLLLTLQGILKKLGYCVSEISSYRCYITKRADVERFFREIAPANPKHSSRYEKFCVGM